MLTDWKRPLRREASLHGMCEENRHLLESAETKDDVIALYTKTIDWAPEEGYPSMTVLRQYFSDCEYKGIFIDKHFNGETLIDLPVYVFHNCTGTIKTGLNIEKKIIPMLYFANGCDMDIRGISGTYTSPRVPLYVFGLNRISGEHSDAIDCITFKFDTK